MKKTREEKKGMRLKKVCRELRFQTVKLLIVWLEFNE
jgi:hypothetical protein